MSLLENLAPVSVLTLMLVSAAAGAILVAAGFRLAKPKTEKLDIDQPPPPSGPDFDKVRAVLAPVPDLVQRCTDLLTRVTNPRKRRYLQRNIELLGLVGRQIAQGRTGDLLFLAREVHRRLDDLAIRLRELPEPNDNGTPPRATETEEP